MLYSQRKRIGMRFPRLVPIANPRNCLKAQSRCASLIKYLGRVAKSSRRRTCNAFFASLAPGKLRTALTHRAFGCRIDSRIVSPLSCCTRKGSGVRLTVLCWEGRIPRLQRIGFVRAGWYTAGMAPPRHGPHTSFCIHVHLVWVTKYRKPALAGAVGVRVRDLIRETCGVLDVHIIRGSRQPGLRPLVSVAAAAGGGEPAGASAEGEDGVQAAGRVRPPAAAVLGPSPVARGYFCRSSGQVTDEVVKEYIEQQGRGGDAEFGVEGAGE